MTIALLKVWWLLLVVQMSLGSAGLGEQQVALTVPDPAAPLVSPWEEGRTCDDAGATCNDPKGLPACCAYECNNRRSCLDCCLNGFPATEDEAKRRECKQECREKFPKKRRERPDPTPAGPHGVL